MLPSPSSPIQTTPRLPWYRQLYVQVLIAIALGVGIGHFFPDMGVQLKPLGDAFGPSERGSKRRVRDPSH